MKIIFIILFLFSTLYSQVEYYNTGFGNIEFKKLENNVNYKIKLQGTSYFKKLLFKIEKLDQFDRIIKTRDITLKLQDNHFDCYYLFKDGKGYYNITVFGNNDFSLNYKGLCYFKVYSNEDLPKNVIEYNINAKIIDFVNSVIGKQVGRGECWDLAAEALDYYSADWQRPKEFGILLNPEKDEILPGDIIQMYNLKFEYENKIEYFGLPEHTAIVYKVLDKDKFQIAHQNVEGKRYVVLDIFDLKYKKSGYLKFYRPVAGLICNE